MELVMGGGLGGREIKIDRRTDWGEMDGYMVGSTTDLKLNQVEV
jgi:hypothetical protein